MKQLIFNIAYLYDKNSVAKETINSLSKSYAEASKYKGIRKLEEFPLYLDDDMYEPSIDLFITKLLYARDSYHLVLVDFVPRYDGRQSSLKCLLMAFNEHHIKIPWILLNGPDDESIIKQDLIDTFPKTNISNLKYFHNLRYTDKKKILAGDRPASDFISSTIEKNILELEENDFLRHAISGEKFIKTLHIPGFKDINDNSISLNLTNEKCNTPDYFVFGGDYLLGKEDKRFTLLFSNLESKRNGSKFLYAKSCSDEDKMFIELLNEHKIDHTNANIEEKSKIVPFIIRNEEMPITILNICFSQINEHSTPELIEQDYNSIRREIESIEEYSSKFETDIKIIYCHYDLFYQNGTNYEYNIKLEQFLKDKGFFLLIHDHTHDIKNLNSKNFIHINKGDQNQKSGIPRIAGGHFDKINEKSELRPFYLSFNFIQDIEMPFSVKTFDFKVWISSEESKKNNFIYDDNLTREFNKKYNEIANVDKTIAETKITKMDTNNSLIKVVILTAIKEEYLAVRNYLNQVEDIEVDDTIYGSGVFEYNGQKVAKVVIRECGKRNVIAGQETERAIRIFKPNVLLFVGIAGSRKPSDFALGDVIFPEKVYSYEGGKAGKESFFDRPDLVPADYSLYELAKNERRKEDWKSLIKDAVLKQKVKADIGIIASGEQLIDHYDSEIGKLLKERYNDTSAVEMEGFGFAQVASRQGREMRNILTGVVRGISDILEQTGNEQTGNNANPRSEVRKREASETAAAFALWLVYKESNKKIYLQKG